ncbi:MAG: alkylation response protein AidB-like acyl-CoA dehydrogenase [Verrucomicrobiales bacterium]|jgi:alkylation response protein AidB-like acyl-CoA dehydrogenase
MTAMDASTNNPPHDRSAVSSPVGTEMLEAMLDNEHPRKMAAAEWARQNLDDSDLVTRDHGCEFWREGWRRLGAHGMLGLLASPEHGGQGLALTDALLELEGLGLGCRDDGLVFAATSQVLTFGLSLERFASAEQCAEWMPKIASGEAIGSFSMSEPGSGSDAFSLQTTAIATDEGYVLNGEKAWVTMAPIADVFIVFATTDPALGRWGVTAFCIPADTPGLDIGANRPKMGMRTTPFSNISFTNCFVPESARIGAVGAGASIFSSSMEAERGFLLVGSIGALERVLDDAVSFGRTREQFGQPIGAFQGVSHALSDVKLSHESARLLMYKAAALQQRGESSMMAAALSKLAGSQGALAGALAAVEIHGARGYVTEYGVERDLRNLSGGVIYGGASGIQKNIVARLLGLPA